jgi:hypothetical protein
MDQNLRFADIYEPSGLVQLTDGRLLVVEDEQDRPVHLLQTAHNDGQLVLLSFSAPAFPLRADDLEGVAAGPGNRVYAVTSHTPEADGSLDAGRKKLLRFTVGPDGGYGRVEDFSGLLPHLLERVAAIAPGTRHIDIEGLSLDRDGRRLLFGLRQPVVGGRSVVLSLENPAAVFDSRQDPVVGETVILLELGGGGIRAMTFAPCYGGYLLANEVERNGDKPRSCLWLWDGDPGHSPMPLDFPGRGEMKNIEGLAVVAVEGREFVLAVCDDGHRGKGKGAHYRFFALDQLAVLTAEGERLPLPGR